MRSVLQAWDCGLVELRRGAWATHIEAPKKLAAEAGTMNSNELLLSVADARVRAGDQ